ncbi:MAG: 2-dehydro-3-deoxy-D-gluconate 5-dehydrogenase KduD [Alphaproteobacteria bacterium]
MFSLQNKVAIVTGANTGLGQGMAIGLAKAGADIALVGISKPTETIAQIKALGRKCVSIDANLLSIEPIETIIEQVISHFGGFDILVNNAGIIRREDSLDFSEKDWDDVMNINIKVPMFLSQAAARHWVKENKKGKIINIASMLSFQGGIRVPSYTSSKSAVMGLTRALANEWAKYNINVNAIAPGYMATDNTQALRADKARSAEILNRIPQGRWGEPKDLAGPIVFLASEASDYVNGYTIAVDGGWLAR